MSDSKWYELFYVPIFSLVASERIGALWLSFDVLFIHSHYGWFVRTVSYIYGGIIVVVVIVIVIVSVVYDDEFKN